MIDNKELLPISFFSVFIDLTEFAKKPLWNHLPTNFLENPAKIFPYLFGIDFILMFFLSALMVAAGAENLEHETNRLLEDNPLLLAFAAILFAPIMEEFIFRFPIGPWFGRYFSLCFWLFTLIFALVHLANFSSEFPLYLAPILVLPQFFLGIVLGYIRTGWGIGYSVLFHALHNGILVGLVTLGTMGGVN